MWGGESYPQRQAFGAGGPDGSPGRPPGPATRPTDGQGVPGSQPPGPGRGARQPWPTWWIAPFAGGALAVLAVFAVLQLTVFDHSSGHSAAAASPAATGALAAPSGQMPVQMFPDTLFKQLTNDLQDNNEKGFLSLVAPSAQPAVRTWWDNMQAIGFTTGLVMPTSRTDQVGVNSQGNGTATILAGTHNALDPMNDNKQADVPLETYQIGLHFSSAKAIGVITAWKPLGDDPWDGDGTLYVRKSTNVVVAGPAADSAVVDETLPIAQAAAAYDVGLINQVHPSDLRQEGFVVFVSGDPGVRSQWFATTKQPSGWPPASATSGLTAQFPGPGTSADTSWKLGNLADDTTGGARVVITPFEDQNGGTAQIETAELVARFALDVLSADDQSLISGSSPPSVPAWAVEGFGVAFEAAFDGNTNPAPSSYNFSVLNQALEALPASFKTGAVPTTAQLYSGTETDQQDWRVVAASVYAYIATKAGMGQLLGSAALMWTQFPDPRGNVLESSTNGTLTFFGKDTIQSGWEAYLANPSNLAPAVGPSGV
jgi:hypothetical protein